MASQLADSRDPGILRSQITFLVGECAGLSRAAQESLQFAVRSQPALSQDQTQTRMNLLRMTGHLLEKEFEKEMDQLVTKWLIYRQVSK